MAVGGCQNKGLQLIKDDALYKYRAVTLSINKHELFGLQMMVEVQSWPYSFPASKDFQKSEERGNIFGRLLIHDR